MQHLTVNQNLFLTPQLKLFPVHREKDLEEILSFIEKLNELDTSDVEPLIFLSETSSPLREDRELPHVDRDQVMRNAPETDGEYFLVPKVIDDKSRGLQ